MPALLIKDIPPELHVELKRRARANRRSMAREALVLLERGVADPAGPPSLEAIDRGRVRGARPLDDALLDEARSAGRP